MKEGLVVDQARHVDIHHHFEEQVLDEDGGLVNAETNDLSASRKAIFNDRKAVNEAILPLYSPQF